MKKLVIYFSHTGENYMSDGIRNITKGNTEIVAEQIAKLTNADLFKVETIIEYPYGYYDCCKVAEEELRNNERPKLKNNLLDISQYDTIYVGYPIWCGTCPMAIFTVLENLDFTGKIIKPFATHEGSGLASSISDIKRACPNAIISEGLAIRGSNASNSSDLLENWI